MQGFGSPSRSPSLTATAFAWSRRRRAGRCGPGPRRGPDPAALHRDRRSPGPRTSRSSTTRSPRPQPRASSRRSVTPATSCSARRTTATVPGTVDEPTYAHSIGAARVQVHAVHLVPDAEQLVARDHDARSATDWAMCQVGDDAAHRRGGRRRVVATEPRRGTTPTRTSGATSTRSSRGPRSSRRSATTACSSTRPAGRSAARTGNLCRRCTSDPVTPGRAVERRVVRPAHADEGAGAQGLGDEHRLARPRPTRSTRPDPNNPTACKTDVRRFSWILHENAGRPKENYPARCRR